MDWQGLTVPGVETPSGFAAASTAYAAALIGVWALVVAAFRVVGLDSTINGVPRGTWALKVQNLVHHAVVSPLAIAAIWHDAAIHDVLQCWGCSASAPFLLLRDPSSTSVAALALAPITVGFMVADIVLISQWNISANGTGTESPLMVFHHVLSCIAWPFAIVYDFCARYVLVLLSYEFSSVFLAVNWLLSNAGLKETPAYLLSGFLFTCSFVLIRMLGAIPQVVAMANAPPWNATVSEYPGILAFMPYGSLVLVLPHVLNFFWGFKVVRGAAAIACGPVHAQEENGGNSDTGEEPFLRIGSGGSATSQSY